MDLNHPQEAIQALNFLDSSCLACGFHGAIPLFDGGLKPLATLGWPETPEASVKMPRYGLEFIRCLRCGHIYNRSFEYQHVPYVKQPNLMYNASPLWQKHQQAICERLAALLPSDPVVIEIGCGSGGFLKRLAQQVGAGRFIGFDPNNQSQFAEGDLMLVPELFIPVRDLPEYKPDLILSRHVLEHLINPLAFLQAVAFYSSSYGQKPRLFFEVPCVDRILKYGRLEDLYYEHNSHFTSHSFETLLKSLPAEIEFIEHGYNQEVIFGLIQLSILKTQSNILAETQVFRQAAQRACEQIPAQIQQLIAGGQRLALWGGTGKGAAFVHHFNLASGELPLVVVDSDLAKVGTYVPGTPYRIESPQKLLAEPVDVILIPAQWRAQDIVREIQESGIPFKQLLLEHEGCLVDFFSSEHPYHLS